MLSVSKKMVNELNDFYCRFNVDSYDCSDVLGAIQIDDSVSKPQMTLTDVVKVFKGLDIKKATWPDGLSASILKTFAEELAPAWVDIFQRSINLHIIPAIWKKSIIIPFPKRCSPQEYNDYRPDALTCIVRMCLERIMVWRPKEEVKDHLDPH